jgi:hypothetical protein
MYAKGDHNLWKDMVEIYEQSQSDQVQDLFMDCLEETFGQILASSIESNLSLLEILTDSVPALLLAREIIERDDMRDHKYRGFRYEDGMNTIIFWWAHGRNVLRLELTSKDMTFHRSINRIWVREPTTERPKAPSGGWPIGVLVLMNDKGWKKGSSLAVRKNLINFQEEIY